MDKNRKKHIWGGEININLQALEGSPGWVLTLDLYRWVAVPAWTLRPLFVKCHHCCILVLLCKAIKVKLHNVTMCSCTRDLNDNDYLTLFNKIRIGKQTVKQVFRGFSIFLGRFTDFLALN